MICSEAGRRMEKLPADGALVGRPPPVLLPPAAVGADVRCAVMHRPMAHISRLCTGSDCWLHRSTWGGVESSYLRQQLLAEVEHLRHLAVLDVAQPVSVGYAHVE